MTITSPQWLHGAHVYWEHARRFNGVKKENIAALVYITSISSLNSKYFITQYSNTCRQFINSTGSACSNSADGVHDQTILGDDYCRESLSIPEKKTNPRGTCPTVRGRDGSFEASHGLGTSKEICSGPKL